MKFSTGCLNHVKNAFRVVLQNICICSNKILHIPFRVLVFITFVKSFSHFTLLRDTDHTDIQMSFVTLHNDRLRLCGSWVLVSSFRFLSGCVNTGYLDIFVNVPPSHWKVI